MIARIPRRKRIPVKRSTLKNRCDRLWSLAVRARGECELARYHVGDAEWQFPCAGVLQAQHGFGRRYLGTRFVLLNGFAGCAASHRWYQTHPIEWTALMMDALGSTVYEELRQRALNFRGPLDYRLVADALR